MSAFILLTMSNGSCNCIHRHLTNDQKCPMCKRTSLKSDLQNNIQLNVVIRSARLIRQAQQMPSSLQFPLSALDASLHETSQDVNSNDWALDTAQIQNDQRKAETFQLLGDLFQSLKISLQSKMDTMQRQLTHLEDGIQQAASSAQQYTTNMQMSNIVPDVPTSGHRMGRVVDMNDYHHGDDRGWASIKRSYQDESLMIDPPATPTHANDTISYQHRRRIEQFYPELGDLYLNQVANQPVLDRTQPVGAFSNITSYIETLSQNRTMRSLGRMRYGDSINASAIVSSIEFNVEDTHFALAGVTRKIKLFEINSFCDWMRHHRQVQSEGIIRDSTTDTPHLLPIREITGPNRISCVSWNHYNPVQLASADYDGIVTILDTSSGKPVSAYQEHECRAWSVDYAPNDRTRLASGSDDAKVKIWSTSQATSAMTIYGKANICTVRFSPKDSNILTFGCADHYAYCYDLRYPSEPLYVCQGHRKAISCIRYLDADTFITVSTDASLKSWSHSESGKCLRTYKGHVNDKNFVGLSVSHDGQWISCGSEDNNIYTYFAPLTQPAIVTPFNTTSILRGQESRSNDATLFVSAVAWRRKTNNMIAGNSHGEVKMLELSDE
ncbi:WD40-repeat-containing domain protein [Syncephalis fuscata]|nr:WD40-repeat-containing domain protein [Syncephalis fuscata]